MTEMENKRKLDTDSADDHGLEKKRQSMGPTIEPITVSMDCPAISVGAIIGKKGANVQEIMKRSGCKIVIDQSDQRDGAPKKVNLSGPPDKLAVAMQLVTLIIKDGANALFEAVSEDDGAQNSVSLQSESRCPKTKVGEVIGLKGATIAEIMRRSSCKVRIVQEAPTDGNSQERQVVYNGTSEQINEAKALVQSVIDQGAAVLGIVIADHTIRRGVDSGNGMPVSVEEDLEPEKVGIVIGAKGCIISEIMKKSGAKMVINQDFPKGQPHKITFTGLKDQVEAARSMVHGVVSKGPSAVADYGNSQTIQEMDILQKQTGKVLGPQGSTIKEMQSRLGVKLNIQVSDSAKSGEEGAINKLKMTGTVDAVRSAKLCVHHILGGGSLETYNFPLPMGGNHMMQSNNNYMPQMNYQQQQPSYSKPPVPSFNGQQSYYPAALTSTGYGQIAPVNHHQSSSFGGSMGQNPTPNYGNQNPTPNYGAPMAQNPTPSYRPQPTPAMTAPTSQGASLGLGADGTSGVLEPPTTQADGSHQQIANVRSDVLGKIIGKAGVNITLIKTKSGASVHVVKTPVPDPSGYTKVMMAGAAADVYLATQMIQEILVNGPSKLSQLSDKPQSAPANYNSGGYKAPQSSSYSTETSYPASTGYNQSQFGTTSVGGQFAQQNYSQMPSSLQTPTYSQGTSYGGPQAQGLGQSVSGMQQQQYNYSQQQYQQPR